MTPRPKIVLLGMLTKMPVGGVAWLVGHYAVGFERLGFDVYYVEAHARTPSMFVEDEADDGVERASAYLAKVMARFGMTERWAFHALHADGRCVGMSSGALASLYRDAALIINMHGGTLPLPEHSATGRLVLLSTDPVELELELERNDQRAIEFLEAHVARFTWGLNHGNPDCKLPWDERYPFVPSPPPIVLDQWSGPSIPGDGAFTTIGNWRQDWRRLQYRGERYGWSKHEEFMKVLDLPARVPGSLELALSSATDTDRQMLRDHGWSVTDGLAVSRDMEDYRDYIYGSLGEFSVAKDQNVRFRSGWFSERSACYLAAGRPVVLQDTGFRNALPTGDGLLTFTDVDTAAAAAADVMARTDEHSQAARAIAAEYLNADVVLTALLDHVGISVPRRGRTAAADRHDLPAELCLVPTSRRPLVLHPKAHDLALQRPVPGWTTPPVKPAISVVMVVLDNLAVTRLAIESVLDDSRPDLELIVVDNGSADDTRQYLSVLAARQTRVRLIRNPRNRGFAPAVNQALAISRGDVLVIANNDVVVPPGSLERLTRSLDDHVIGLAGPVTNRCGNEAEVPAAYATYREMCSFAADLANRRSALLDIPVATMFCVAMRRDTYELVGELDERFELGLFEDDDYSRRVRDIGRRVVCAPDAFVHHFGEASLGVLAASGHYGALFEANRRRFEHKWGVTWHPHARSPKPDYDALVTRLQQLVRAVLPAGAVAAIVSKGDPALLPSNKILGLHFPCTSDGDYVGHHPADGSEVIDHLVRARRVGATHFVLPAPCRWWLTRYPELARYLDDHHTVIHDEPETAVIYSLDSRPAGSGSHVVAELQRTLTQMSMRVQAMEDMLDELQHPPTSGPAGPAAGRDRSLRRLVRHHVPWGSTVLVTRTRGDALLTPSGRTTTWFDLHCAHRSPTAGSPDCTCAIARLEAMRARGAEFLLIPAGAATAADAGPVADHLVGNYAVTAEAESTWLFDLRSQLPAQYGWSRSVVANAHRIAALLGGDVAVLDWTRLELVGRLSALNVFTAPPGTLLPYLDSTVPLVLIDHPEKLQEANRVASAAVISVGMDQRPIVTDIHVLPGELADRLSGRPLIDVVIAAPEPDERLLERVRAALADQLVGSIATSRSTVIGDGDFVVVLDPGVLPLPGAVEAALTLLRRERTSAVAGQVLDANGKLVGAGVTVFADGTWSGIAQDCADLAAPWHHFVRDVCGSAGLLVVTGDAFREVHSLTSEATSTLGWAGALWSSGHSIVYQPESVAVQCEPDQMARSGMAPREWDWIIALRPEKPSTPLSDATWRALIATDDVTTCNLALLEEAAVR